MSKVDGHQVEKLPNGYVKVRDVGSGLVGLFFRDGSNYAGDLRRVPASVTAAIRTA